VLFFLERSFSLITGHGYPCCPVVVKIIVNFPFGKALIFPKIIMGPSTVHQLKPMIHQGHSLRVGRGCLCLPPVPPVPPGTRLQLRFTKRVSEDEPCRGLDLASCTLFICADLSFKQVPTIRFNSALQKEYSDFA